MSRKESRRVRSPLRRGLLLGALIGAVCLAAVAALGAVLIDRQILPKSSEEVFAAAGVFLAALFGPIPLFDAAGKKRLFLGLGYTAVLLFLLLLFKWLRWPDAAYGGWPVPSAALAGALLFGFLRGGKKGRRAGR